MTCLVDSVRIYSSRKRCDIKKVFTDAKYFLEKSVVSTSVKYIIFLKKNYRLLHRRYFLDHFTHLVLLLFSSTVGAVALNAGW